MGGLVCDVGMTPPPALQDGMTWAEWHRQLGNMLKKPWNCTAHQLDLNKAIFLGYCVLLFANITTVAGKLF